MDTDAFTRLQGHTDTVTKIAYSGNGDRMLSSSLDKTVRVWNINTGECIHTMAIGAKATCVSVLSDNSQIIVGTSESKISFYNMLTYERIISLMEHGRGIKHMCLSNDETFCVSCGNE